MRDKKIWAQDSSNKAAHDIYSLYFIGWICGYLAFVIAFVWASIKVYSPAVAPLYKSHFRFQQSVAWQGLLVFLLSGLIWYFCYPLLNWQQWWHALVLVALTMLLPLYWCIKRCIMGFNLLKNNQAVGNPYTFLYPKM